jgi:endonuclease-3
MSLEEMPRAMTLAQAFALWSAEAKRGRYRPDFDKEQISAVETLIQVGEERIHRSTTKLDFETGSPVAEDLLNDIETYPHMFLLGCVMDRQITAGRAWALPFKVGEQLGGFDFARFAACDLPKLTGIFKRERLHRFPAGMAECFYKAVGRIAADYNGDATRIWASGSSSAGILRRLLEFDGIGLKIANMAVNILARDYQIPMTEYASIDIAPDSRVAKFFHQHRLIKTKKREELIYLARELYPWYPGILDIGAWEWNR